MAHRSAARSLGRLAAAAVFALVLPVGARGQEEPPVILDSYDELNRVVESDSLTYYLSGNVRAHRGDVHMRSQRAVVYRKSGVADFQQNVHFWDSTTELYADHVVYFENADVAVATGSVQVIDRETGSQLKADSVHYDRSVGMLIARPRPEMVLLPRDTTAADAEPLHVWADEMRFMSDSTRSELYATRNVLVERSDLTAIGDSLYYNEGAGRVALRIGPQVETAETYLTAEQIDVTLTGQQQMESLIALGGARALDKRDSVPAAVPLAFDNLSPTSFLEGDSLHIAFIDESVDWIVSDGRARSYYYVRESPPGPVETWALNYLLGRQLRLNFRGDTLDQVVATGGHRGVYRSEEVRVGGPQQVPSEPIPLSEESRNARSPSIPGEATRPRRAPARAGKR
jgi:lipopolysaccharide export system protein LptA